MAASFTKKYTIRTLVLSWDCLCWPADQHIIRKRGWYWPRNIVGVLKTWKVKFENIWSQRRSGTSHRREGKYSVQGERQSLKRENIWSAEETNIGEENGEILEGLNLWSAWKNGEEVKESRKKLWLREGWISQIHINISRQTWRLELILWPEQGDLGDRREQDDEGEVSNIIFGMSESSGFQKYSICWVFQAICPCLCFYRCLCNCHCLCVCLCLCIYVLLWSFNSFHHKLWEYVYSYKGLWSLRAEILTIFEVVADWHFQSVSPIPLIYSAHPV